MKWMMGTISGAFKLFFNQDVIETEGSVEYLMADSSDGTCGFVAQHTATFNSQSITTLWEIVPDLGTEAIEGLVVGAKLKLAGHGPFPFNFEDNFKLKWRKN